MKTLNLFTSLLLVGLLTGCATVQEYSLTYNLWSNDELRNFAEPAPDPHMALYQNPDQDDLLVTYDESYEQNRTIRRRAYYLKPNLERIANNRKPHFVDPQTAASLNPIPLASATTNTPAGSECRFTASTNGQQFTVLRGDTAEGPYELPVYVQQKGKIVQVALTPFAVVGDTVMVGVVASFVALVMACYAGVGGTL